MEEDPKTTGPTAGTQEGREGQPARKFGKPPQVEELVDYYLNRRVAAQVVKLLLHTPLTPNQVSFISMLFSVAAAGCLFFRDVHLAAVAGLLLYIGIVLDCADGQLARARGGGSLSGRIVDGVCDYISGIALFAGATWFATMHVPGWFGIPVWALGIAAALSTIVHCALQDHKKNQFLRRFVPSFNEGAGTANIVRREIEIARGKGLWLDVTMLKLYFFYSGVQKAFGGCRSREAAPADAPPSAWDLWNIRFWSFLGFTTHLFLLVIACFVSLATPYAIFWYLVAIAVFGNILLAALILVGFSKA